ncbi:MAG: hypothetical protein HC866_05990 [Leptolyngbyaceae cyanobacterium RU_5_1]|nr:hypothetical protein [Leptolyngbyaceae cyanobacterium RU_5_1]
MARRLVIEITESAEYLEKSLKQAKSGKQKERLQMLWWLKTGQVVPRPVSLKQPDGAVEGFKNFRLVLMELEAIFGISELRYLAQDETRIGRKTETQRVITAPGVKPKLKVDWPRQAFWLYGVVEPLSGWQWTQEYSQ